VIGLHPLAQRRLGQQLHENIRSKVDGGHGSFLLPAKRYAWDETRCAAWKEKEGEVIFGADRSEFRKRSRAPSNGDCTPPRAASNRRGRILTGEAGTLMARGGGI
jgi:hypothetical protein